MSPLHFYPHLSPSSLLFILHELPPLSGQEGSSHSIPLSLLTFFFVAPHELLYVVCVVLVYLLVWHLMSVFPFLSSFWPLTSSLRAGTTPILFTQDPAPACSLAWFSAYVQRCWNPWIFFFKYEFIYFNWRLITLQYCSGFAVHWHEFATGVHVFPILNPPPTCVPIPSLWVIPVHQSRAPCLMHWTCSGNSFHVW